MSGPLGHVNYGIIDIKGNPALCVVLSDLSSGLLSPNVTVKMSFEPHLVD